MKIDLLFPQTIKCFLCGGEIANYGVCDSCYPKLPFITGKTCERCGGVIKGEGIVCNECSGEKFYFHKNYAIFHYADDMQKVILSFKGGNKYLGGYFSEIVRNYINKLKIHYDVIIPTPIHPNRRKERGFNQSEILLEELKDDYPIDFNILERVKDTPHQTGLNKENRMSNLDKAFKVIDKNKVVDKIILIVDDIYTTGSTLNEMAKALLENGAKGVIGLSLARASIDNTFEND